MSKNMLRHATLVNATKSPLNFLLDFYTNQTCQSCLVRTSPWTSSVYYHLHNGTELDIADLYFTHIFPQTGLPESIICDRDTKFTSKFWETLMQRLKIKLDMSTAFHPQTDGSTEIANKTIIQILRNWVSMKQDN